MNPTPRFLQGIIAFTGHGINEARPLDPPLTYTVRVDAQAQCVYFRGGNTTDELICVVLLKDDQPMRLFPIGARDAIHVPLRITEELLSDTRLDVHIAAPAGTKGTVVVDLGLLEL